MIGTPLQFVKCRIVSGGGDELTGSGQGETQAGMLPGRRPAAGGSFFPWLTPLKCWRITARILHGAFPAIPLHE